MSIKEGFLVELERETKNTERIIKRLKDEDLAYRPHEKSMSLGELINHIVELHNWVSEALTKDDFNFQTDYIPLKYNTVEEIKNSLEEGYKKNVETIKSFGDEEWFKTWTMRSGDHVIAQVPKLGALRFILNNHLIHHRGQLTVYLRLLNIPVPGLYGPSADEHK